MRPCYSQCSQSTGCWADMERLGYHRTYFDLDTADYLNDSPTLIKNSENIVQAALAGAAVGSDLLTIQHDIHQYSVQTLSPYFFDLIQKKAFKGVSVGECLNDPPQNWYRKPGTGEAHNPYAIKQSTPSPSTSKTISSTSSRTLTVTVTSTSNKTSTSTQSSTATK